MAKLRIVITGVTGLLGRNLLFEIIKQNLNNIKDIEIFLLGRQVGNVDIRNRMFDILTSDGKEYLDVGDKKWQEIIRCFGKNIKPVEMDLNEDKLRLSNENFKSLKSKPIDFFFHVAALTDFRDSPSVVSALENTNVHGTSQILTLVSSLKVNEFDYVGSAYSCGRSEGNIPPDYVNFDQRFRNPYEITKLQAELLVRDFEIKNKIKCRYFRPSTICGRLLESPMGSIHKFDVIYAWAAFFLKLKARELKRGEHLYDEYVKLDIRLCYNLNAGINVVPVDYCAKIMYRICINNCRGNSYHLVNNQETPHSLLMPYILQLLNIGHECQVSSIPSDLNKKEAFYYKTVGKIFTPYADGAPMLFNVDNVEKILKKENLSCPQVGKKSLEILVNYAKEHNFGMQF